MSTSNWRKQFKRFQLTLPLEGKADRHLALSAFLAHKKKALVKSSYFSTNIKSKSRGRRQSRRIRSKILKLEYRNLGKRSVVKSTKLLLYKLKNDHLRDTLCPKFKSRWKPIPKRLKERKRYKIILSDFSFCRNPKGTIKQIRDLARLAAQHIDIRIDFTDKKCDDVAPYIVLFHVIKSLPPVFTGGKINREVAVVLESVGLDRLLGVRRTIADYKTFPVLPFKMAFRAPPGYFGDDEHLLRPQYKEFIADRFCNSMEKWLEAKGFELTEDGAEALTVSITEALDNAERHGCPQVDDGLGDWSMGGFARIIFEENEIRWIECSVAIVSIGSTISSSLQTAGPKVSGLVDGYTEIQSQQYGIDLNLARTIVALQDGITRVEAASRAKRGGIGLLTLAEIFAAFGETDEPERQSVFTILSGDSCLRLTTPYHKGKMSAQSTLRNLWFNDANDGMGKPSPEHAFRIGETFAGTIMSACFSIDPAYMRKKLIS